MHETFLHRQHTLQTSETHSMRTPKACVASNKKLISQQSSVTISELFPYALDHPENVKLETKS
jgi:hypothetical protein